MANENQSPSYPPTLQAPLNYPNTPMPGKIQILFDANKREIYHKFSPYTDRGSLIGTGQKQPYIWRYPDEKDKGFGRKLPKALRVLEDIGVAPTVSGADDVERVTEWLTSGYGIQYTITQAILQAYQPFNETAIYNPLSPLLATIYPLSLGLIDRPTRFIDQGSILGAVLSTLGIRGGLIGGTVDALAEKALGRSLFTNIPPGSAGGGSFFGFRFGNPGALNPLPRWDQKGGKGLLRGRTALAGQTHFKNTWGVGGAAESIGSFIRQAIDPIIPTFIPRKTDAVYRADEKGYTYMTSDEKGLLSYYSQYGAEIPLTQMWFAEVPRSKDSGKFIPVGTNVQKKMTWKSYVGGKNIDGKMTGYSLSGGFGSGFLSAILGGGVLGSIGSFLGNVALSVASPYVEGIASVIGIPLRGGINPNQRKYGQSVGIPTDPDSYTNSDILLNYASYISAPEGQYATKQDGNQSNLFTSNPLSNVISSFKKILSNINTENVYRTSVPKDSRLASSGNPTIRGYNKILNINKNSKYKGVLGEYTQDESLPYPVDDATVARSTMRMATSNKADGINQLTILNNDRKIKDTTTYSNWTEWNPYRDDMIAFFFYDVVNQKYIPFRATITGINETGTAMWDEMKFIGRADMVYSYSGFSRNLAFQFKVLVSSLSELLPTWKRINYIASAIKPSNYTKISGMAYNKFMVPPMFMINIGDMYKYQPCIITSVVINIPDDAIWETLNEDNSPNEWTYLNGIFKSNPRLRKKYAQFPREAEISITANLLEKERAIVGGAHFGHAPHTNDYEDGVYLPSDPGKPYFPTPSQFDQGLVEYQKVQDSGLGSPRNLTNNKGPEFDPLGKYGSPTPTQDAQVVNTGQFNLLSTAATQPSLHLTPPAPPLDSLSKTNKVVNLPSTL